MFVDLDGFKRLNDALGHGAGDRVLVSVGERLEAAVRTTDTVARYGGDEFVVVLEGVGGEGELAPVLRNLRARLAAPFEVDGRTVPVSCSLGTALFPRDGYDVTSLLSRADERMYAEKRREAP